MHNGLVTVLDMSNVDTDQIVPKQFLKRIERSGFGPFLFFDWRFLEDGTLNPAFEMNAEQYKGASILLTRTNFGCGSSREHAVWSLLDYGIKAIIAPSFADIFYNNCFKNGILPITLSDEIVGRLFETAREESGFRLEINLETKTVRLDHGLYFPFKVDPHRRHCLMNGLDDILLTLQYEDKITEYESQPV
ncbi:MAG: 3-isopropylmalate dehydratase small subunit [Candidatus Vogelbacteria bacterium]|nr:3-isopropylmalate dehydratase small subunit [Candidatus Vogelbacteria bacterium]